MTNATSESDVLRVLGEVLTVYLERQTVEPSALPDLAAELRSAIAGERVLRPRSAVAEAVPDHEGSALAYAAEAPSAKARKAEAAGPTDAERIAASVKPDCIVCLEDGQSFRSLKRHLRVQHGMTPEEYRAKWGLPKSYPLVAPALAEQRSRLAYQGGFGRDTPTARREHS